MEKFGPLVLSVLGAGCVAFWSDDITASVASKELEVENLYAAVLSWASIQIGFAFAVYGFVVGKTQGFIEEARDTIAMARFLGYVKRANIGGFLLTAFSLPLAAISPSPKDPSFVIFWVITLWFCLFLWTFFAFLRVAYNFGHLTSVRDAKPFYGA
jgi:hypothetical protein